MRSKAIAFLIIIFPQLIFAQFVNKKIYNINRIYSTPKIDGQLNDDIWQKINTAKGFSQISPNNGTSERDNQKTEVKICYDDQNIYFGVMMYDNSPDSILKELSKRDEENKNFDKFGVWINPFNNGQIEYNFTITAAGVQIDRKFSSSEVDSRWNAVWESAVQINKKGWVAEFSIPFSQLRFPNNNQEWALNMMRTIRRYREDYSWNPIDISYEDFALQAGLIRGINNIKSPIRLSLMPYASTYINYYDNKSSYPYNYGIDLRYGINESFTLDMTLIPDFGQVSADAMVLNLAPSEIKYEEKRQFFNEGTELFNKGDDMFYSRRLQNSLLNATKITGRTKEGLGVAILNAITNKTNQDPLKIYNIMMFDQALEKNSSISLMNTNLIKENNNMNVTGLFSKINNKQNTHSFSGKIKISQNSTYITSTGCAGEITIEKINGNYRYRLHSLIEDNKYNPEDIGLYTEDLLGLRKNDEIRHGIELSYHQLKESKKFIESEFSSEINYQSLFTKQEFVNLEIKLKAQATLKNYMSVFIRANINPYEGNNFYESRGDKNQSFKQSKSINIRGFISTDYRKQFALDIGGGGSLKSLYDGSIFHWRIAPRYRINDKISVNYILSIRNKYNDVGYATNDSIFGTIFGVRNTNMITNVFSTSYILNNKMDVSIKLRYHLDQVRYLKYNLLNEKGYLTDTYYDENHNINYTTWTSDITYNWWFAPGSQVSIVWKNGIDITNNNIENHWIDNIKNSFDSKQEYSLSLKVIYYLDYLYLKKS
ncbi:MAG: DUF5916 domain-containing protein [Bacteroidota bacterium]|nr:DUF5916 domain-containing protein [Bacteroidota bacterium]